MSDEIEETEKDASSLIEPMLQYLERLDEALEAFSSDVEEMGNIKNRVMSDRTLINYLWEKIESSVANLSAANNRNNEIKTKLTNEIRIRKTGI